MEQTDDRWWWGLLLGFVAVVILMGLDLVADGDAADAGHLALEAAVFVVGVVGAAAAVSRVVALRRATRALSTRLAESTAEAARYRAEAREALQGLSRVIDEQLERWRLTPAEKETALLLLKGLSHKEIATVRAVSEATARQQAGVVYKKAGLAGRNELAAFFLEDLLLPAP